MLKWFFATLLFGAVLGKGLSPANQKKLAEMRAQLEAEENAGGADLAPRAGKDPISGTAMPTLPQADVEYPSSSTDSSSTTDRWPGNTNTTPSPHPYPSGDIEIPTEPAVPLVGGAGQSQTLDELFRNVMKQLRTGNAIKFTVDI